MKWEFEFEFEFAFFPFLGGPAELGGGWLVGCDPLIGLIDLCLGAAQAPYPSYCASLRSLPTIERKKEWYGIDIGVRQDSFHATLTGTPHASICPCRKSITIFLLYSHYIPFYLLLLFAGSGVQRPHTRIKYYLSKNGLLTISDITLY